MNSQKKARNKLRGILLLHGMTLKDFAERYGYTPELVRMVAMRYWGQTDKKPRGKNTKTIEILDRFESYCRTAA